jgi:DNA-binding transcriptional MerR regulator
LFPPLKTKLSAAADPAAKTHTVQELSSTTGVSVASIKFYLREGLLPPGDPSRPGRAYYDATHARRLLVIRALRDVGELSIDVIRRALAAVDAAGADAVDAIAPAIDALATPPETPPVDAELRRARKDVTVLFERAKLEVRADAGSRETIARTIASLRRLGVELEVDDLRQYLSALVPLTREEIENERTQKTLLSDKEHSLELAILGTVLFEPIIIGLRRALHEHFTTQLVRSAPSRSAVRRSAVRRSAVRRRKNA